MEARFCMDQIINGSDASVGNYLRQTRIKQCYSVRFKSNVEGNAVNMRTVTAVNLFKRILCEAYGIRQFSGVNRHFACSHLLLDEIIHPGVSLLVNCLCLSGTLSIHSVMADREPEEIAYCQQLIQSECLLIVFCKLQRVCYI